MILPSTPRPVQLPPRRNPQPQPPAHPRARPRRGAGAQRLTRALCGAGLALLLGACAGGPAALPASPAGQPAAPAPAGPAPQAPQPDAADWHAVALPGKEHTQYEPAHHEGRAAWRADSQASASMWRKRVQVPGEALGPVSFSWWVERLVPGASVADREREDAPARVMFGFHGDLAKLPLRTRMMFELAEALTGEQPPYATLMYVWDSALPVGTVLHNPRSDRIRKIVVDSGPEGLKRWREHRRDLAADFRLAFGEEPGALTSIALMTDSDNTRSSARSWYGEVRLLPAEAALPAAATPAATAPVATMPAAAAAPPLR